MSTQSAPLPNQQPQYPPLSHRRLLRRAEKLYGYVCAYQRDACSLDDLRALHHHLSQMLALPEHVLRAWENQGAPNE